MGALHRTVGPKLPKPSTESGRALPAQSTYQRSLTAHICAGTAQPPPCLQQAQVTLIGTHRDRRGDCYPGIPWSTRVRKLLLGGGGPSRTSTKQCCASAMPASCCACAKMAQRLRRQVRGEPCSIAVSLNVVRRTLQRCVGASRSRGTLNLAIHRCSACSASVAPSCGPEAAGDDETANTAPHTQHPGDNTRHTACNLQRTPCITARMQRADGA